MGYCIATFDWMGSTFEMMTRRCLRTVVGSGIAISKASQMIDGWPKSKRVPAASVWSLLEGENSLASLEVEFARDLAMYAGRKFSGRSLVLYGEDLCQDLADLVCTTVGENSEAVYGFGFQYSVTCNPLFYSLGITVGMPANSQEEHQSKLNSIWFRERLPQGSAPAAMRHIAGKMRDVFPLNILSLSHLDHAVCGKRLHDWILSEGHGELRLIGQHIYSWTVPADRIRVVREVLANEGVLLTCS